MKKKIQSLYEIYKRCISYTKLIINKQVLIALAERKKRLAIKKYKDSLIATLDVFLIINFKQFRSTNDSKIKVFLEQIYNYEQLFVFEANTLSEKLDNHEEQIISQLKSLEYTNIKLEFLFVLHDYFMLKGRFLIANNARDLALKIALNHKLKIHHPVMNFYKFKALIDTCNFTEAQIVINFFKKSLLRLIISIDEMQNYYYLFIDPKKISKRRTVIDEEFYSFVNNKNIAIIGPINDEKFSVNQLDKFDIIIRMNFQGFDFLTEKNRQLGRNYVSYYNPHKIRNFIETNNLIFNELDYTVVKNKQDKNKLISHLGKTRIRVAKCYDDFAFIGIYNMTQVIIQDLLHFSPNLIGVFNINLFTKLNYQKNYQLSTTNTLQALRLHDPKSQINLLKNISINNDITFDNPLNQILRYSDVQFLTKIQNNFWKKNKVVQHQK